MSSTRKSMSQSKNSLLPLLTLCSKPYITFAEFIDYVFEQGLSRASKQKEIVFTKPKEIKINAQ